MMCEKCWADAFTRAQADPSKPQALHYRDLLWERQDDPCNVATIASIKEMMRC